MKIALCLYGIIGGDSGKGGTGSSDNILKIGYERYKSTILDHYDVDIFVHTWDEDYKWKIIELYRPYVIETESQIYFNIPDYVKGDSKRKNNHYSRWYSTKKVVELMKSSVGGQHNEYDLVMLNRFDTYFENIVDFSLFDPNCFNIGRWCEIIVKGKDIYGGDRGPYHSLLEEQKYKLFYSSSHQHKGLNNGFLDWFFVSNVQNIYNFSRLYDCLDEYNRIENCPVDRSNQISNHRLSQYHINKMKIKIKEHLHSCKDFGLIRRRLLGCKR